MPCSTDDSLVAVISRALCLKRQPTNKTDKLQKLTDLRRNLYYALHAVVLSASFFSFSSNLASKLPLFTHSQFFTYFTQSPYLLSPMVQQPLYRLSFPDDDEFDLTMPDIVLDYSENEEPEPIVLPQTHPALPPTLPPPPPPPKPTLISSIPFPFVSNSTTIPRPSSLQVHSHPLSDPHPSSLAHSPSCSSIPLTCSSGSLHSLPKKKLVA